MQFRHVVSSAALLVVALSARVEAQACGSLSPEPDPGPESEANGRVGGALGGGLFAGLVMAVLHLKHHDAALSPQMGSEPVGISSPVVEAPSVTVSPGTLVPQPLLAEAPSRRGEAPRSDVPLPSLSAREARQEGLVPPKTATLLPAFVMAGVGAILFGLFLLRYRSRRS